MMRSNRVIGSPPQEIVTTAGVCAHLRESSMKLGATSWHIMRAWAGRSGDCEESAGGRRVWCGGWGDASVSLSRGNRCSSCSKHELARIVTH